MTDRPTRPPLPNWTTRGDRIFLGILAVLTVVGLAAHYLGS